MTPTIKASPRQATFVFLGIVSRLNASNLTSIPSSPETAVVNVEEVLHAPEALRLYGGVDVTVRFVDGQPLEQGRHAIFFTMPWVYGENLAVQALGILDVSDLNAARKQALEEIQSAEDEALRQRLTAANLVVEGAVASTRAATYSGPQKISEHDPDWWIAIVTVEAVEKGQSSDKAVEVAFAHSQDIAWYRAPKLREGTRGVFLLHRMSLKELDREMYTVTDPLDVHLLDQGNRVRALL